MSKRKTLYEQKTTVVKKPLGPPPGIRRKKPKRSVIPKPKQETKFHDAAVAGFPGAGITLTGTSNYTAALNLTSVPQGTDRDERIGREIFVTQLHVRATVFYPSNGTGTNVNSRFRCVVFIDKEAQTLGTNAMELLYKTRSVGQLDMNTLRNMEDDPSRFKILYNQMSPELVPVNESVGLPGFHTWETNLPVNLPVKYPSTGVVPVTNAMYIAFISDYDTSAIFTPQFYFNCRIMFADQ